MTNSGLLGLLRHCFGIGTLSGIYTTQVVHVHQFVWFGTASIVYLFSLLSFYFLLYGYEAKLLRLPSEENLWRIKFFKRSLIAVNILLTLLEVRSHYSGSAQDLVLLILQGLFSVFGVVFPEMLLPLIFDDTHIQK